MILDRMQASNCEHDQARVSRGTAQGNCLPGSTPMRRTTILSGGIFGVAFENMLPVEFRYGHAKLQCLSLASR